MANISLPGAGGGFDYAVLLDRLMANSEKPLLMLEAQQKSYEAKLSAFGTLQNVLSGFKSSATTLSSTGLFHKLQVSTTGTDVLGATIGTGAVSGSWKVIASQLATAQSLATAAQANSTTPVGNGTVKIEFGEIEGGNFVPNPDKGGSLNVRPGDTMEDIAKAINKNADMNVNATIVDNGSGKQLVLTSKETGESSIMKISVTGETGGTGLTDMLTYDPAASGASNMTETVAAQNAKFKINNIDFTRTSNTVTGAIAGVTLTLTKTGEESTVTVRGGNKAEATTAIKDFVAAFNKMQEEFDKLSTFDADAEDPNKRTKSPLNGDSTLRSIRNQIRTGINGAALASIGIDIDNKGVMKINEKKLSDALDKDPDAIAKMFSGSPDEVADGNLEVKPGIANGLIATITDMIDNGLVKNAKDGVEKTIKSLEKKHGLMELSLEKEHERYKAQFIAVDKLMTQLNGTMSYLTQQFEAMNSK